MSKPNKRLYLEWMKRVAGKEPVGEESSECIAAQSSFEGYLYREAILYVDTAVATNASRKRNELLETASQIEQQLVILLKDRNLPLTADAVSSSIATRKSAVMRRV